MSVYVDPIFEFVGPNGWTKWSHMFADTLEELHEMADAVGMKRAWFQNRDPFPHYDLTPIKRRAAVELGAVELVSTKAYLREVLNRKDDTDQKKTI